MVKKKIEVKLDSIGWLLCDTSLSEFLKELEEIKEKYEKEGYFDFRIDKDYEYHYGGSESYDFYLYGKILEEEE